MGVDEVIDRYVEKFGGWPAMLFMGAEDDYIIDKLQKAIDDGEPIEATGDDIY